MYGLWYPYKLIKFGLYDLFLSVLGYKVWNPIKYIDPEMPYDEQLMVLLENLKQHDYVCFQYDWLWSDESKIEFSEAASLHKKIVGSGIYTRKFFQFLKEME